MSSIEAHIPLTFRNNQFVGVSNGAIGNTHPRVASFYYACVEKRGGAEMS